MSSQLRVRRLHADVSVPMGHPAPERARADVAGEVATRVPRALGAALARVLRPDDGGVWVIRRLDVDVHLGRRGDPDALAGRWAHALAAALRAVMDGEGDPANVVRFRSAAEELASYIGDRLDGDGGPRWHHRGFDGLRMLPQSAALRTVLERDRAKAVAALARLGPVARRRLVAALSEPDAERVFALLLEAGAAPAGAALERLAEAFTAWREQAPPAGERRGRLALALAFLETGGEPPPRAVEPQLAALVRLRMRFDTASADAGARLLEAMATGRVRPVAAAAGAADATVLAPLLRAPQEWLDTVLAATCERRRHNADGGRSETSFTPFGGGALLLAIATEFDWDEPGIDPAALRLAAVLEALGPPAPRDGLADPVLRALYGAEQVCAPLPPAAEGARLLRALARRLPGFGRSSDEHLRRNFLYGGACLTASEQGWTVELERPPLHVILRLSGLDHRDVWVPWLDRTIAIRSGGPA
jgi:hypothetical protein